MAPQEKLDALDWQQFNASASLSLNDFSFNDLL
jgi:hypothetical protein